MEHASLHAIALVKALIESEHYKAAKTSKIVEDLHTLTAAIADLDKPKS